MIYTDVNASANLGTEFAAKSADPDDMDRQDNKPDKTKKGVQTTYKAVITIGAQIKGSIKALGIEVSAYNMDLIGIRDSKYFFGKASNKK